MNVWKYINKKESAESMLDTAPAEDFSHIYDAVIEKQEELDILYAEKVVKDIEAEENRAAECLAKIKGKISEALGHEATDEQVAEMMQRLK